MTLFDFLAWAVNGSFIRYLGCLILLTVPLSALGAALGEWRK